MDDADAPAGRGGAGYRGTCPVCGWEGRFERGDLPPRESYACGRCGASLRYQAQAAAIVGRLTRAGARCLADLAREPHFRTLSVWEPGTLGPLRRHLRHAGRYQRTTFDPAVAPGRRRRLRRNEDLMALTFADESFDLIVTSDVLEHVRHPDRAWTETHRVLRPGGMHIFSLPFRWPIPATTTARVDVTGPTDRHLLEPRYHRSHLVFNDFGADVVDQLRAAGFEATLECFETSDPLASRLATVVATKA